MARTVRGIRHVAAVLLAAAVVVATPGVAWAAAPAQPTLVAPPTGATGVATTASLRIGVSDPDGEALDVRFFGRPTSAPTPAAGDFTFAVIPDTQNYGNVTRRTIMTQQTQWLVDNRASLNLSFVAHLGDLVGSADNTTQWGYINNAMRILDTAGVPSSVTPGNHDYDNVNSGTAALYKQTFPVSRYAQASWNSPTASYGGYLGQNQFGPDPVDTQNMNSYALFSAGGMDFLVLNVEFDAPDYVLDWAKRVLAANPARRAILVTHSFVDTTGNRSPGLERVGGNSPVSIWNELVAPSCSIFLVVNGHWHSGTVAEARRTDPNSCGQPVHQVLSDYQDLPNGGNGWLRYYTFSPSTDTISARTYSPFLGSFDTDAASQFTLPYDMPAAPATAPEIGRATVASGTTASLSWANLTPNTAYTWYATVSDGTTTVTSPSWSFTTGTDAPSPTVLAADAFGRTVSNGWGSAETGGAWTSSGTASRFSVAGGTGVHVLPAGVTNASLLNGVSSTSTDVALSMGLDALRNGSTYLTVGGRRVGASDYAARVKINANGSVELHLMRSGTAVVGGVLTGVTLGAGERINLRLQVDGVSPTTVRARAWKAGVAEPTTWQRTTTDSTAALQAAGSVAVTSYQSSSTTNGSATVRYDDLSVRRIA